jgi:hypothetical protein
MPLGRAGPLTLAAMFRHLLKSKIHRATASHCGLLDAADTLA